MNTMTVRSPIDAQFSNVPRKNTSRQIDFWDSFKPIYYFSRCFGLMPFSIRCDSNGEIQEPKVNRIDGLWFLFTIAVFFSSSYISHQYISGLNSNTPLNVSNILNCFHLTLTLIFGALMIAMDMCNRFKLVKLWKNYTIFDEEVRIFSTFL